MELISGRSLEAYRDASLPQRLAWFGQVLEGVAALHRRGFGDLKNRAIRYNFHHGA